VRILNSEDAECQQSRKCVRDITRRIEDGQATSKFPAPVESREVIDDQGKECRLRKTCIMLGLKIARAMCFVT